MDRTVFLVFEQFGRWFCHYTVAEFRNKIGRSAGFCGYRIHASSGNYRTVYRRTYRSLGQKENYDILRSVYCALLARAGFYGFQRKFAHCSRLYTSGFAIGGVGLPRPFNAGFGAFARSTGGADTHFGH